MFVEHLIRHLQKLPAGTLAELPDGTELDVLYFHPVLRRVEFGSSEGASVINALVTTLADGWQVIDLNQEPG